MPRAVRVAPLRIFGVRAPSCHVREGGEVKIIKIKPVGFAANSYILTQDGVNAVAVDPAQPGIADYLAQSGLKCRYVLLTHGHFDHVGGCGVLYEAGAKILCGEKEKDFLFSSANRGIFGGVPIPEFEVSQTLRDGEKITLCGMDFQAISTPGHTVGGMCYLTEDTLFSGDTLFRCSVGRTDLPTGNAGELAESLKKLFALKGDYTVRCGHEEDTSLEFERRFNPYARF